jgi:hypothetical protein
MVSNFKKKKEKKTRLIRDIFVLFVGTVETDVVGTTQGEPPSWEWLESPSK